MSQPPSTAAPTPERANEIAFEWLSLHGRHAPHCKRVRCHIVPQEPRSGLCKDYGGRYATEEELEKIACTCGLDDMQKALCQAAAPETAAERDRLVVVNEGLVEALEKVTQIQRDKCENASAEMLFMLLDNKVGIAQAALSEARKR